MKRPIFALVALLIATPFAPVLAQTAESGSWSAQKCERYRLSWTEALARGFARDVGADFRQRHEAFLASGCAGPHDVCPRSEAEMNLANVMTVAAMNAGTASTFPPFGCPR